MTRILSIWLPHFPLERRQGSLGADSPSGVGEPAAADAPFALTSMAGEDVQLTAVNSAARRLGLRPGMTLTAARALFPALRAAPADPAGDSRALHRLALWCARFASSTAVDGTDGLRLDVSDAASLWGGEANLVRDVERFLAALGFTARLAVADTSEAAWALARFGRRTAPEDAIVPPGQTRAALAGLPVQALRLAPETLLRLKRLGLHRISDLYALPRVSLERRFPAREAVESALLRLDQALGERSEPARDAAAAPGERESHRQPPAPQQRRRPPAAEFH